METIRNLKHIGVTFDIVLYSKTTSPVNDLFSLYTYEVVHCDKEIANMMKMYLGVLNGVKLESLKKNQLEIREIRNEEPVGFSDEDYDDL